GAAYRFETSLPQQQVKIYGEEVKLNFPGDATVFYPQEDSMFSHNERKYVPQRLKEIDPAFIATMPAVVDAGEGTKLAIAESDVEDYPGMWLHGTNGPALAGTFPHYPLKEKLERDRDFRVVETADYIAATSGTRTFPWRLVGIVERDGDLLTNQLVWLLAKPPQFRTLPGSSREKSRGTGGTSTIFTASISRPELIPRPTNITSTSLRSTASSTSFWTKAGTDSETFWRSFRK